MSDEIKDDVIIETTKAVASDVYKDAFQPALKAAGSIIALPLQIVDAALSGPKLWVTEKQYNYERTKELLAEKMKDTPPEKIVPPDNYVAVPALQQISYCFDSDELRDMYANLLAASMHEDKKWEIHPAFVDIIKQLTPDEAKLLKALPPSLNAGYPILAVHSKGKKSYKVILINFTDIADGICDKPQNISAYLENLDRLKLIELGTGAVLADESQYDRLKNTPTIKRITGSKLPKGRVYDYQKGAFRLSSFGLSFVNTCILGK